MNSPHHPHHGEHHDVHQQRLLWFFSFCNQRSSSSSNSSSSGGSTRRAGTSSRRKASSRNKFAAQYQQQLQQQQRQSSDVFGCDLIEHTRSFGDGDSVPCIVKSCARFIEKHGIIFGIYRLSGMRVNIHKLRQDFDKNPRITMIDSESISNDAHAVACVLKQYFRELPTPLLTFHMYEKFIELFKHSNSNNNNKDDDDNISSKTTTTNRSSIGETSNDVDNEKDQNDDDNCNTTTTNIICDQGQTLIAHDNNPKSTSTASKQTRGEQAITTAPDFKTTSTSKPTQTKPKSPTLYKSSKAIATARSRRQTQFTTSASDSQLLSLSSVVTTTTSDIKYQVKLEDLKKLLHQLPKAHYQTLKFLMRHLACIAENGQKTGMDSKNVAIVWAPNLLKPRELELSAGLETLQIIGLQAVITEQLIKHHEFLFEQTDSDSSQKSSPTKTELITDMTVDKFHLHVLENVAPFCEQRSNTPVAKQQNLDQQTSCPDKMDEEEYRP